MMFMIPRAYQPETPASEKAGEGFAPPADVVERMMKYNEELAKASVLISLDGLHPLLKGFRVSFPKLCLASSEKNSFSLSWIDFKLFCRINIIMILKLNIRSRVKNFFPTRCLPLNSSSVMRERILSTACVFFP
jgi:hypothetical protein